MGKQINIAPQPLTIGNIVFGKEYLLVEMWRDGSRHIKKLIIIEEVKTDEDKRCLMVKRKDSSHESCHDFSQLGLIPEKLGNNNWRVFENTQEILKILQDIVKDTTPERYLDLIGCQNHKKESSFR